MIVDRCGRGALPALGQPKTPATIPYSDRLGKEFRHRSFHTAGQPAGVQIGGRLRCPCVTVGDRSFRLFWHECGRSALPRWPVDADYRRVRRLDNLGSSRVLSTVVDTSGCAFLLLYASSSGVVVSARRLSELPCSGRHTFMSRENGIKEPAGIQHGNLPESRSAWSCPWGDPANGGVVCGITV